MRQLNAKTLKTGTAAADRRLVAGVAVANGAPTVGQDQMVTVGLYDTIDVTASCTGAGGSYEFTVWWWIEAAEKWVADATFSNVPVSTAGGVVDAVTNPYGAGALYIEVVNFAGGGVASVWAAGRA